MTTALFSIFQKHLTVYTEGCIVAFVKRIYLKAARMKAGLTQEELESKSTVRQAVISRLERNAEARPAFETVVKLADALNIDPRSLRFGQPESIAS